MVTDEISNVNNNSSAFSTTEGGIPFVTKGRNTNLSLIEKLEVIKRIDSNIPYSKISQEFNIAKGTVNKIKRSRDDIMESVEASKTSGIEIMKRTRFSKDGKLLDSQLMNWISETQERGELVSGKMVQEKALEFATENNFLSFKASNGWLQCFQRRHASLFGHQDNSEFNGTEEYVSSSGPQLSSHSGRRIAGGGTGSASNNNNNNSSVSVSVNIQNRTWRQFKESVENDPLMHPLAPHLAAIDAHLRAVARSGNNNNNTI